jgi:hypothetical protein
MGLATGTKAIEVVVAWAAVARNASPECTKNIIPVAAAGVNRTSTNLNKENENEIE